ncbi:MAG: hypothetical protein M1368_00490 [Thaumarchaeota archaeon]|nr:hypothetical protein [Nitrososphaerota archaeon]
MREAGACVVGMRYTEMIHGFLRFPWIAAAMSAIGSGGALMKSAMHASK